MRRPGVIAVHVVLWSYAVFAVGPLLLMLVNSFRPSREIFNDPLGLPSELFLGNYVDAWTEASFSTYAVNSVVVVSASVALGAAISVLAAYPLGRLEFRGRGLVTTYIIAGLTLPAHLGILPLFFLLDSVGLVNSRLGLVLLYAGSAVPFSVFVLSAFFRQLPTELEEAAELDGAGTFRVFWHVMLPLVRPAVATVVVFQFVPLWNDFFYPLVLMRDQDRYTLPVGLTVFFGEYQNDWGPLFAALVMTTLPLLVLFIAATRQIISGLTAGMSR